MNLVTEVATSEISIHAPDGELHALNINLNVGTVRDLKRLIERKIGVAVGRQVLTFKNLKYGAHGMIKAGTEITGDDVLSSCDVKPNDFLVLSLRPKERAPVFVSEKH